MAEKDEVTEVTTAPVKRSRKLIKDLSVPGEVSLTAAGGTQGKMTFKMADLPKEILDQLPAFGAGHKLGDSAAGRSGTDAEDVIQKTWKGMVEGNWTVRLPAQPKVSIKEIDDNLAKLPPKERAAAEEVLKKIGIALPA